MTTADPLLLDFASNHPDEFAATLATANLRELAELILDLPATTATVVATRLPSWQLTGMLGILDPEKICQLLLRAHTDDAIAIVSHLHESSYDAIIDACPEDRRLTLRQLFDYPSHSLAALAGTGFIRVEASTSCEEFARQLTVNEDTRPRPVLVVDNQGRYRGLLSVQAAVSRKNRSRTVGEVATAVEPLSGLTSAESALKSRLWSRYNELPVVDGRQRLLGVVSRSSLQRVSDDPAGAEFTTERLFAELATGYLNTCARLLEAMLGRRQ